MYLFNGCTLSLNRSRRFQFAQRIVKNRTSNSCLLALFLTCSHLTTMEYGTAKIKSTFYVFIFIKFCTTPTHKFPLNLFNFTIKVRIQWQMSRFDNTFNLEIHFILRVFFFCCKFLVDKELRCGKKSQFLLQ